MRFGLASFVAPRAIGSRSVRPAESRARRIPLGFDRVLLSLLFAGLLSAQNSANWVQQHPQTSPSARAGNGLAYDAARGQVVLFGGSSQLNDTWVWNGSNWTQKSPQTSPPARSGGAMVYDSARGQVVMFGGSGAAGLLNDTWVWDGSNWTQKFPQTPPAARLTHVLGYDAAHAQVVLFGGRGTIAGNDLNDTWVWDGANWTRKFPQTSPAPRGAPAMVYDAAHGQMVLFGGLEVDTLNWTNETWVWDGSNWTQLFPQNRPMGRWSHAMAYDAGNRQVVMFGGAPSVTQFANDTWSWDGSNWTQQFPQTSPAPRSIRFMAYDSMHEQAIIFGGAGPPPGNALFDDTWVWSSGPLPPASIKVVSGDGQSGPAGLPLPNPAVVAVSDTLGNPVAGVAVSFAATNAVVSPAIVQTDLAGRASTQVTLGSAPGPAKITASFGTLTPVTLNFTVGPPQPSIEKGGVVPIYSSSSVIQPGSWISIYGRNLVSGPSATWNGDFPASLGGTTVTINSRPGYLWFASAGQINLQAPDDTATGPVNVTVTNSLGSASATVTLGRASPSFNLLDGKHAAGIIVRSDGSGHFGGGAYDIVGPTGTSLGYPTVAAKAGDTVLLFGVGFGPTNPPVPAGKAFSGVAAAVDAVQLTINGLPVTPAFVGMSAAGQFQFNLTLPGGLGTGDVALVATVDGVQTPSGVVLSIQ